MQTKFWYLLISLDEIWIQNQKNTENIKLPRGNWPRLISGMSKFIILEKEKWLPYYVTLVPFAIANI